MSDKVSEYIGEAVAKARQGHSFAVNAKEITPEHLSAAFAELKGESIYRVQINNAPLEKSGALVLVKLLDEHPELSKLDLDYSKLGDEGMAILAPAIRNHPQLSEFSASGPSNITAQGMKTFFDEGFSPKLRKLELLPQTNPYNDPEAEAAFNQMLKQQDFPNLVSTSSADDAIIAATAKNTVVIETLVKNYPVDNPDDMDARFLHAVYSSQRSVFLPTNWLLGNQDSATLQETKARFERLVDALPALPSAGDSKALFIPNDTGFAPVDNPRLWYGKSIEDFKAIPLTKDVLGERTPKGSGLLDSAFFGFRATEVLQHLNETGVQLRSDALLADDGKPSELLKTLIESGKAPALFTPDNWRGASKNELHSVYKALPENQQAKVGINALAQQISTTKQGLGR